MTLTVFLLALGAAARLTRLITDDFLLADFRLWVARRAGVESKLAYLVECPWCLGLWFCAVVFALASQWGSSAWFTWPAAALSASWLYGVGAQMLDGE